MSFPLCYNDDFNEDNFSHTFLYTIEDSINEFSFDTQAFPLFIENDTDIFLYAIPNAIEDCFNEGFLYTVLKELIKEVFPMPYSPPQNVYLYAIMTILIKTTSVKSSSIPYKTTLISFPSSIRLFLFL